MGFGDGMVFYTLLQLSVLPFEKGPGGIGDVTSVMAPTPPQERLHPSALQCVVLHRRLERTW